MFNFEPKSNNKIFSNGIYFIFTILIAAFILLTYLHDTFKMAIFSEFEDFCNYYLYSKALRLNYNVYTLDEATKEQIMRDFGIPPIKSDALICTLHSPAYSTLFLVFTFFEYRIASLLWFILNHILLITSVLIILRLIYEKIIGIDGKFIIISSIFLVFVFQPLIENMDIGQVNPFVFFFFVLCLYFLNKKRYAISGAMLSLGILIKPHFILLLPFLLWKKCYRVFFSALISFIILEILGILINGSGVYADYLTQTSRILYPSIGNMSMRNLSLGTLINRVANLAVHPSFLNVTICLALFALLLLFAYLFHVTKSEFKTLDLSFILEFSLAIIFVLIAAPIVHEHYYIMLYLPILFLWAKLSRDGKKIPLFLFFLSFLLIGLKYSLISFPMFRTGPLAIFSGLKLYGVLVLFFLTAYVIRKDSRKSANTE